MIPLFRHTRTQLPDIILTAGQVMVRPPRQNDEQIWLTVRARNRDRLKSYEPTWADDALTPEFFHRKLARQTNDWIRDHNYAFLIFDGAQQNLVGGININHVARGAAQFASLGYWIDSQVEGQGYMRDGLTLVINYAFNELQLHRVNAATLVHNDRSKNLLQRLGFTEEGRAANYLEIDGRWQDHILYGRNRFKGEHDNV